jgi:drug/metabolite transporter (DMT)-like permease
MNLVALIAMIIATILWGINPLLEIKYLDGVHISTVSILFFTTLIIVLPGAIYYYRDILIREIPMIFSTRKDILYYGFFGMGVSLMAMVIYLLALQVSGSQAYVVVAGTAIYPLITAVLLHFIYKHEITPKAWLGIALIIIGGIFLADYNSHVLGGR